MASSICDVIDPLDKIINLIDGKRNSRNDGLLNEILGLVNAAKNGIIRTLAKPSVVEVEKDKPKSKLYSQVLIKSCSATPANNKSQEIENRVTNILSKKKIDANILSSFSTQKGDVVIRFKQEDDIKAIVNEMKLSTDTCLKDNVKVSQSLLPKMTIQNIPKFIDLADLNKVKNDILNKNEALNLLVNDGKQFEILFKYDRNNSQCLVIRCSPEIRSTIIKSNYELKLNYRVCKVTDRLHISFCTNCCSLGHNKSNCNSNICCSICAENHSYENCPNKNNAEKHKCVNCSKSKNNVSSCHSAFSPNCPIKRKMRENLVNRTMWGTSPPPNI